MWKGILGGVVVALLAISQGWALAQPADEAPRARGDQVEVQPNVKGRSQSSVNGKPADSYWLGLQVSAISDDERHERRVPKGEGVIVTGVMADSPAAKAGFKSQDVVHRVGKKVVKEPADLSRMIRESKGQQVTMELIRDGKRQTFTITPEVRGKPSADGVQKAPDWTRWLPRPEPALPDDMTVTITKMGKNQVQVLVQQGSKKWESGEQDLDKLPETARPYVERMLQRPRVAARSGPDLFSPPSGMFPKAPAPIYAANPLMEKRLQEMNRRIDRLQQTIDELRRNPAPGKARPDEEKK
jgi:membrane-associated protease RseP (regulator of RpoE activity)